MLLKNVKVNRNLQIKACYEHDLLTLQIIYDENKTKNYCEI